MRPSLWLLLSALVLGCQEECTDVGCASTLIVELSSEAWADGEYDVSLEAEGETFSCSFEVTDGKAVIGSCPHAAATVDTSEFEEGYVLIRYGGSRPAELSVSVELDGEELDRDDFEPEYEEVDGTVDACSTCLAAQVSLKVPGAER